jgi:ubiquinone/menaquinone biosynthesis C-methylase UbiE
MDEQQINASNLPISFTDGNERVEVEKDFLWLHLKDLPYFRSLIRAIEARFFQDFDLPAPTLDVGCGDGHFATVAFEHPLDVGLDPWEGPIRAAARRGGYRSLVLADGGCMPFPSGHFSSAVSNSVLEHIPHVEAVLGETARVLKPGAPFLFCVPNNRFLESLSIGKNLDRVGLRRLGDAYRCFFNRISRHQHSDQPEIWLARLEAKGFEIEKWWHYLPPRGLHVVEWGHYFGLPSLFIHLITGRWVLVPRRWNLALTRRIIERYYIKDPRSDQGVYTFYVARRKGAVRA